MRKSTIIYLIVSALTVSYLLLANKIFYSWIKLDIESARITQSYKEFYYANSINMRVDNIEVDRHRWKDMLQISGWAFNEMELHRGQKRYVLLFSKKRYYLYDVNDIHRPEISKMFSLENSNAGFSALFPLKSIRDGRYRLGIVIEDDLNGFAYAFSNQYFTKTRGEIKPGFLSQEKDMVLLNSNSTTNHFIDKIELTEDSLIVLKGWAFIDGEDAKKTEHYIVLKSGEKVIVFEAAQMIRNNIEENFKNYGYNLNHSGFEARIQQKQIPQGINQVGMILISDERIGNIFPTRPFISHYGIISGFLSRETDVDLGNSCDSIVHFIDQVDEQDGFLSIRGWGFFDGVGNKGIKHFIVLDNNRKRIIYDTDLRVRMGITSQFGKSMHNLDSAGFEAKIPITEMPEGDFVVGLGIITQDRIGFITPIRPAIRNSFSIRKSLYLNTNSHKNN